MPIGAIAYTESIYTLHLQASSRRSLGAYLLITFRANQKVTCRTSENMQFIRCRWKRILVKKHAQTFYLGENRNRELALGNCAGIMPQHCLGRPEGRVVNARALRARGPSGPHGFESHSRRLFYAVRFIYVAASG